ncbi:MAG TPA: hypothetical protein PK280_13815 [Planctomycetota bacterium]|nr:hypothetical protein [Planctomycetota bacterium]
MTPEMNSLISASLFETVRACMGAVDRRTGRVKLPGLAYRHQHLSYPLAWLYATKLPGNALYRSPEALELAMKVGEFKFTYQTARGGYDAEDAKEQGDEWQAYFLLRTMEVLGARTMGAARWKRWSRSLERYADCHGSRPFFFSAPNHEAWKALTLDLAGRILRRPDLVRMAAFGMSQLLRYQLAPGFWDENRHHGPSMSYNYVMADPLYMYWRATGREDVRAALERLIAFMGLYALPDGSTSGALDGRVAYSGGRVSPALTLTPRGRRLNELGWLNWIRPAQTSLGRGGGDVIPPDAASGAAWTTDLLRFAGHGRPEPLGQESDGFLAEEHDGNFHALARRQGPWHLALSGVFSDIPKETDNIFRLERQNRIDLWHERTGLILGGGHTHRNLDRHFANLYLDTGYFADVDFGLVTGRFPETVRATYYPRLADVSSRDESSVLELTFGHAQAEFALRPLSTAEMAVEVGMESVGLRRAFAGLPLVIAGGADVLVDGRPLAAGSGRQVPVRRRIEVAGSFRGASWEVELPRGASARVSPPFSSAGAHFDRKIRAHHRSLYEVALLALELRTKGRPLTGPVVVRVK